MKKILTCLGLGICIGILLSVAAGCTFGPRGASTYMNLYDGATWTDHHWLGHNWRTEDPVAEHTRWARSHMTSKHTYWPVFACANQRSWFGGGMCADGFARDIVREIYGLPVSEERKIAMLREFHEDISNVAAVDDKEPLKRLYKMWDAKLEKKP